MNRALRKSLKRVLPAFLRGAYTAVENAVRYRLYMPSHFRVCLRDFASDGDNKHGSTTARVVYERVITDWLKCAQDVTGTGGVAAYYDFANGWSHAYPETTGYIIPTMVEAARHLGDADLSARARRMAEWEMEIQLSSGAWQGGVITAPAVPSVFNTGQIIQGLVCAAEAFNEPRYLAAASRAGHWLVQEQDEDGAWRRYTYNNFPNAYSTRVAWPLLQLSEATGECLFRKAAVSYLEWVSRCQDESGWFSQCMLEIDTPPLTHTLAYTIEGLVEAGILLGDERWIHMGQRSADVLLRRFEVRGALAGTFAQRWRGDNSFSCITGCAQMSLIWTRFFTLTGNASYLNASLKINDSILSFVDLYSRCGGIRGGVKGSHPVWGPYMTYRLPSWAAKFSLDALFAEDDALRRIEVEGEQR